MQTIVLLASCACVLISFSALVAGDRDNRCSIYDEMKCMGKPLTINKMYDENEQKCKEEMRKEKKENKKDRKRGGLCLEVCHFQKSGILDSKGMPVKAKYEEIAASMIPAESLDHVKGNTTKCFALEVKPSPTDLKCKAHQEFFNCIFKGFASVCDEDFDEVDWE